MTEQMRRHSSKRAIMFYEITTVMLYKNSHINHSYLFKTSSKEVFAVGHPPFLYISQTI